jgi:hypothetical protein
MQALRAALVAPWLATRLYRLSTVADNVTVKRTNALTKRIGATTSLSHRIAGDQECDRDDQTGPAILIPIKSIEIIDFSLDGRVSSRNTVPKSTANGEGRL